MNVLQSLTRVSCYTYMIDFFFYKTNYYYYLIYAFFVFMRKYDKFILCNMILELVH